MRLIAVSSLLVLVACGGGQKPADSPSSDTASLEKASGASGEGTSGESASAEAASGESTASSSPSAASGSPAASAGESAAAPSGHPTPVATGSIDGKPFTPKMAFLTTKMHKDGRVVLRLDEGTDCTLNSEAALTLTVPWEDGYKADIGSMKRASKKGPGEVSFVHVRTGGKKDLSKSFKPSGTVTVVKAPMTMNSVGKLKIDLQSGDYMLAGDLDIQVCVAPK